MNGASATHLVLIPSYNTGPKLVETVRAACRQWQPVWVVIDGSTDGSDTLLPELTTEYPELRHFHLPTNRGKGSAILHGLRAATTEGYTHILTLDADGQHPVELIPEFMALSQANPGQLVLGRPVFDASAPLVRVYGRRLSNFWADLQTLWAGIGDSLFGFRVYPIRDLLLVMERTRWMRRFDFEAEAAIRLCWRGLRTMNCPVPVRYFRPDEGGVSHFHYVRDNLLLIWMYTRLFFGFVPRLPLMFVRSFRR